MKGIRKKTHLYRVGAVAPPPLEEPVVFPACRRQQHIVRRAVAWWGDVIGTHSCPPFQHLLSETDVTRHNGGTSGTPLKLLRDDSALRALSSLRSWNGNVGTVGMNGLIQSASRLKAINARYMDCKGHADCLLRLKVLLIFTLSVDYALTICLSHDLLVC